jgi:ABC-2 type transport system ATP-binding protein
MIEFQQIRKRFRTNFWDKEFVALDDISFKINSGDLVGFLGANGAGKTTLIKILMDFIRQDNGEVKFSKALGESKAEIHSKIGYLPERAYLYPHLTGREFLTYSGKLSLIESEKLKILIDHWSKKFQVDHALDRVIQGYSKGMQQRIGFISAIIHEPKFIVLDEPLSGLDPIGRLEFKNVMQELNKAGVTIFFSSHVVSDVEEICNKVVFIEKGHLIYQGSIDELILKNSKDSYRIKFFEDDILRIVNKKEAEKNLFLHELINKNYNIIAIEKERPTLEEIIYKIKK